MKQYCDAFDITHVRAQMEIILSKIARLKTESESIPLDLRDVQEIITKELQYCSDQFSFLTEDYYRLFLLSVAKAIDRFSNETRGRFTASLLPRIPSSNTLSKRYPSARNRQGNYRFYSFGQ